MDYLIFFVFSMAWNGLLLFSGLCLKFQVDSERKSSCRGIIVGRNACETILRVHAFPVGQHEKVFAAAI